MSLIVEYETVLTQFSDALEADHTMTLHHEEMYFTPDREVKWLFWAEGDAFDAFTDALADDPSVESARVVAETPTRWLYSTTLVGDPDDFALSVINDLDIQVLSATLDYERTTARARCPSREALTALRDVVVAKYGRFVVQRLYEEGATDGRGYDVTPSQRAALLRALDTGYFEVPRAATLAEIADELDISNQALSSRLRRGTSALLRDTLDRERSTKNVDQS